ncbi:MAG: MogA/MoaB family molybdenum cofactor biosynthesis protein [Thermodesulfobacteriota bacterium]|nr:MogA/MoaB family molybdenum cofactor biosynthesis protein [Thermodesulfobacteriota bacterium]
MGTREHKQKAPKSVKAGIISVSTTRTIADDKSGLWINKRAKKEGHEVVFHRVVPDDSKTIAQTVIEIMNDYKPDVILLTGGTGISSKDVTIEAVRPMFDKELTAFGPLFTQLSFEQIDSAALLSRATAGVIKGTIVFCMPGSLKACKLACKALIFPELGHLVKHVYEDMPMPEEMVL